MLCRKLIRFGSVGAVIAAICCATPVLGIVLGALGLGAWLAYADFVVLPLLLACLAAVAFGIYRLKRAATR
jgi:mercuric ion transport protein